MQIVFVLLILTVKPQPLNYHAIEISSSYSNCFKESYIWESKKAFRRNTNEKKRRKKNYKGDIEIWLGYFIVRHNYGCRLSVMYVHFLRSAFKVAYTFAKICNRHNTLDKFAEKHQSWIFPKMFPRCCESIILKITFKCMQAWLVGATRTESRYVVAYSWIISTLRWYFGRLWL